MQGQRTNGRKLEAERNQRRQGLFGTPCATMKLSQVVVAINYRLASVAPYPAQLIDAKRALRWVKKSIKNFGGDPNFIIVGGLYTRLLFVSHSE